VKPARITVAQFVFYLCPKKIILFNESPLKPISSDTSLYKYIDNNSYLFKTNKN